MKFIKRKYTLNQLEFLLVAGNRTLNNSYLKFPIFNHLGKFHFSSVNDKKKISLNEIKERLSKEGKVKIYESNYPYNSEKLLIQGTGVFSLIFSTTVLFTNVSIFLKIINVIFLCPCILIQVEYLLNRTRFIKTVKLLPDNKMMLVNMWGKNEVVNVSDMNKAVLDLRVGKQKDTLNHQHFIILTNKHNVALYHIPRDGVFLDEELFHSLVEGKNI